MISVSLIFKIAAIGMLVAVLHQLLSKSGREDIATLTTIAGLVIALFMVVDLVGGLFSTVKQVFNLY